MLSAQFVALKTPVNLSEYPTDDTIHVVLGTNGLYMSWHAAQCLGFQPSDYPRQQRVSPAVSSPQGSLAAVVESGTVQNSVTQNNLTVLNGISIASVTCKHIIDGFCDPFDDEIKIMPGEIFKITLDENNDLQTTLLHSCSQTRGICISW